MAGTLVTWVITQTARDIFVDNCSCLQILSNGEFLTNPSIRHRGEHVIDRCTDHCIIHGRLVYNAHIVYSIVMVLYNEKI